MASLITQVFLVTRNLQNIATQIAQVAGVPYNQGELAYLDLAPLLGTDVTVDIGAQIRRTFSLASGDDFDERFPTQEAKEAACILFQAVFERRCKTADRVAFSQVVVENLPLSLLPAALQLDSRLGFSPPPPPVEFWFDQSGNGRTAAQAVVGRQLGYVGGIVVGATAAGVAEDRDAVVSSVNVAGDWTLYVVVDRNPDVSVQNAYYVLGFNGGATGLFVQGVGVGFTQWGITDAVTPLLSGEVLPVGRHLLTVVKTGTSYELRRDGVSQATAVRLAVFLSAPKVNRRGDLPAVLSGGHGYPEIVAFNVAHTPAQLALVEAYLMDQWGIP